MPKKSPNLKLPTVNFIFLFCFSVLIPYLIPTFPLFRKFATLHKSTPSTPPVLCLQKNPQDESKTNIFFTSLFLEVLYNTPIFYLGPTYSLTIPVPFIKHSTITSEFDSTKLTPSLIYSTVFKEPEFYYTVHLSNNAHLTAQTFSFGVGDFVLKVSPIDRNLLHEVVSKAACSGCPTLDTVLGKVSLSVQTEGDEDNVVCKFVESTHRTWFYKMREIVKYEGWTQYRRGYMYDDKWVREENK